MPRAFAAATPSTLAMPLSTVMMSAGRARRGERDDLRSQAVAVLEAVRHQEIDRRAHRREAAYADRAGRRAVGVVVGDDRHAFAAGDAVRQAHRGGVCSEQHRPVRQASKRAIQLADVDHATRGVDSRQQRRNPGSDQRARRFGHRPPHDVHQCPVGDASSLDRRGADVHARRRRASDRRLAS